MLRAYELRMASFEVRKNVFENGTLGEFLFNRDTWEDDVLEKRFDTREEAIAELEKNAPWSRYMAWGNPFYQVEEYYVAEVEYDAECKTWLETGNYN